MIDSGMTIGQMSKSLGRSESSIEHKMRRLNIKISDPPKIDVNEKKQRCEFSDKGESATLVSVNREIKTAEDACAYANVDMKVWEIDRFVVNKWEQGSKGDEGGVNVVELWQVKVWLKRIVSVREQESFEYLKEVLKSGWKPRKATKRKQGEYMLEVSLYDHHFAKLCWSPEVSAHAGEEENYDTKIASAYYANAVHDHLEDAKGKNISEVVLVVGNDFLNVDNLENMTFNRTPQDADGRVYKAMPMALLAVISAIEEMRKRAKVKVIWIPGNHDPLTSYCICLAIKERYSECKDVEVDIGPVRRKYLRWGVSLLGFTHGDKGKPKDRTTLMMREAMNIGLYDSGIKFMEWHTGHFHQEKTMLQAGHETNGIVERVLPSMSGTDKYHHDQGYVLNRKVSLAMLWHKENGLERTHYAYARK
jgi:hypothetical protein